jgi:hypothetical protein
MRTDARLDGGLELSGHDIRGRLAAEQRLRKDLEILGIRPVQPLQQTFEQYVAQTSAEA